MATKRAKKTTAGADKPASKRKDSARKPVASKATLKSKVSPRKAKPSKPTSKPRVTTKKAKPSKVAAPQSGRAPKAGAKKAGAGQPRRQAASRARPPRYDPQEIEPRWQKRWEADRLYRAEIDPQRQKHYFLTMLPYTSGDLHFGHWYPMAPSDARARYLRMRGYNVMFPIGFDAFGLPGENAAIKRGIHPKKWTYQNIDNMRRQLRRMGTMFDWEREAVTSDPEYYKWTQWFFVQLFTRGLAYKKMSPVDWCPNCNTTLAREQVWGEDRHCERCGTPVIKKNLDQWFFRLTNYAEELLDFSGIDWPERVQLLQTNWIGRSQGAAVTFQAETEDPIEVFTTRPDTLWGATFMVLAPEHPLVAKLTTPDRQAEVEAYIAQAARQSDIQREAVDKDKTGVFTGGFAVNPVNAERIPVWIADYVLMTYGTGAIMGVPAHDQRDFDFALKFGLAILPVIDRPDQRTKSFALGGTMNDGFAEALRGEQIPFEEHQDSLYITIPPAKVDRYIEIARQFVRPDSWNELVGTRWLFIFHDAIWPWDSLEAEKRILSRCHELEPDVRDKRTVMEMLWAVEFYRDALYHDQYGAMIHSGPLTGSPADQAIPQTIAHLQERGSGKGAVSYRLRDWLISRQRYWGAPIPIVHCPEHGQVPVPDEQLPVLLPDDVEWRPTGESPLKLHPTWKNTTCPVCGRPAERDTDTMDTFMCSSWYHYRYLSPNYDQGPWDPKEFDYWMPVDCYTGGIEHATMHLIYTRFFTKALRDLGLVPFGEPMLQLRNQGTILGEDGEKMSKSRGNVVAPDVLVAKHGADALRAYLMFAYRWQEGGPWSSQGIEGTVRWIHRVWALATEPSSGRASAAASIDARQLKRITHQTIRRVSDDFDKFEFNTIVSTLMEMTHALQDSRAALGDSPEWKQSLRTLLLLMAPVTPHLAEELWSRIGEAYSIHQQPWPTHDPQAAEEDQITLVIQVNGKVRDRVLVPVGISEDDARRRALASEAVQRQLAGKEPGQVIYVPGRLVNIVV
jgi:leucyl-tRNA synthetase